MKNMEIRNAAKIAGVHLWQVAEAAGMHDSQLSKNLRRELSVEEKEKLLSIIRRLAKEA